MNSKVAHLKGIRPLAGLVSQVPAEMSDQFESEVRVVVLVREEPQWAASKASRCCADNGFTASRIVTPDARDALGSNHR